MCQAVHDSVNSADLVCSLSGNSHACSVAAESERKCAAFIAECVIYSDMFCSIL